jgi:DNA repair exonuclease SbcCD ATPase subunit
VLALRAEATGLRKQVEELAGKAGEVESLKKQVESLAAKNSVMVGKREENNVETWMKKVTYLEGVIAGMEMEEMEQFGNRIMGEGGGGGLVAAASPSGKGGKGGGGGTKGGSIEVIEKEKEIKRLETALKESNERRNNVSQEIGVLQGQVEKGNVYKKELLSRMGDLETSQFKAEERAKIAERDWKNLTKLVKSALEGKGDGGEELMRLVGMTQ